MRHTLHLFDGFSEAVSGGPAIPVLSLWEPWNEALSANVVCIFHAAILDQSGYLFRMLYSLWNNL